MIGSLQSALSGLAANQKRVDTAASNIANAQTQGYRKRLLELSEAPGGGVHAEEIALDPPAGSGAGAGNSVDLTEEIPALALSSRLYQANLAVVKTDDEMVGSLLDLFK